MSPRTVAAVSGETHRPGAADPDAGLPEGGFTTLEVEAELGLTEAQALDLLHTAVAKSSSHFYDTGSLENTFSDTSRYDTTMKIEGELADGIQFRSLTGCQHLSTQGVLGNNGIPVTIITGHTHRQDKYLSQEFELLGGERTRFQWDVGTYGSIEEGHDFVLFDFLPALGAGTLTNDDDISEHERWRLCPGDMGVRPKLACDRRRALFDRQAPR